jgi:hypothetical protein
MTTEQQDPGSATLEELRDYWRMPSLRATRELANRLGLRRVGKRYPWLAIWAVEGLAPPAPRHWEELKLPHMTTEDLADLLDGARRTAQRVDQKKPDASFPERLRFRDKPKLWRRAQVNYWAAGLPVPTYKTRSATRTAGPSKSRTAQVPDRPPSEGFDPFDEARLADTRAD